MMQYSIQYDDNAIIIVLHVWLCITEAMLVIVDQFYCKINILINQLYIIIYTVD